MPTHMLSGLEPAYQNIGVLLRRSDPLDRRAKCEVSLAMPYYLPTKYTHTALLNLPSATAKLEIGYPGAFKVRRYPPETDNVDLILFKAPPFQCVFRSSDKKNTTRLGTGLEGRW